METFLTQPQTQKLKLSLVFLKEKIVPKKYVSYIVIKNTALSLYLTVSLFTVLQQK